LKLRKQSEEVSNFIYLSAELQLIPAGFSFQGAYTLMKQFDNA